MAQFIAKWDAGYGIHPTLAECEQYGLEPEDFGYEIDEDAI